MAKLITPGANTEQENIMYRNIVYTIKKKNNNKLKSKQKLN